MPADGTGRSPPDPAAQRLVDAVGIEGFTYYSAADERAAAEALARWPLLAGVFRVLDGGGAMKPRVLKKGER